TVLRTLGIGERGRGPGLRLLHIRAARARSDSNSEARHSIEFRQNVLGSLVCSNAANHNVRVDFLKQLLHRAEHVCVVEVGYIYDEDVSDLAELLRPLEIEW